MFQKVILIHQNNFTKLNVYDRTKLKILIHKLITLFHQKILYIFIGKTKKGEIPKYIQVSLYLENENTINREFGAFSDIDDNFDKYVISLDKENKSQKGIIHLNAIDFLLSEIFKILN